MEHYFTEESGSVSEPRKIDLYFDGQIYPFMSDHGVFSKDRLDYGTELLLKSTLPDLSGEVLDLGCGYGPVGVLVYLKTGLSCDMVDINRRALDLAEKNLELNRAQGKVFYSDGFSNIEKNYDVILLNPPIRRGKEVIYRLFSEAAAHLKEGGRLLIVIQKKQGMASARKKLEEIFHGLRVLDKKAGYYVLEARREKV